MKKPYEFVKFAKSLISVGKKKQSQF